MGGELWMRINKRFIKKTTSYELKKVSMMWEHTSESEIRYINAK